MCKMMERINKQLITFVLTLVSLFFISAKATAQDQTPSRLSEEFKAWSQSTIIPWPEGRYKNYKEAMIDNKIFLPIVLRMDNYLVIKHQSTLNSIDPAIKQIFPPTLESPAKNELFKRYTLQRELDDLVYKVMLKDPRNFMYTSAQLPETTIKVENINLPIEQYRLEVEKTVTTPEAVDPELKFILGRKYWKPAYTTNISFSQNKSSDNYVGGKINSMNLILTNNIKYNYQKGKVTFDNEMNTSTTFANAPNDTVRKYTINADEMKIISNLKFKTFKNWDYTISLRFVSALFNKYIPNTEMKHAAFLAPFTLNISLAGMTYTKNFTFKKPDRSWNLVITPSALSYDFKYTIDKDINLAAHFVKNKDGLSHRFVQQTIGAVSLKIDNIIRFNKSMVLTSNFYCISNYKFEYSEGFLYNQLDIALNKYFSTLIQLKLVYNDRIAKAPDSKTYLQTYELFSFGFKYTM